MNDVLSFILDKTPIGVIVYDQKMEIVFRNKEAEKFSKRYKFSDDVTTLCGRIFDAINNEKLKELFPGEVYLYKKVEGSPSRWTFRFHICERSAPFVAVFIIEDTVSNDVDLNKIRSTFKLTRRETDVLRRVLDGLKNVAIAEDFDVSEQTIKDHLSNIYMKIGVRNRFELASFLLSSFYHAHL